jgi:hypothetical protein
MLDVVMGYVGAVRRRRAMAVVLVVTGVLLTWSVAVGRAADYQDANHNVCGGPSCFNANLIQNGAQDNIAFGPNMMHSLSNGAFNDGFGRGALSSIINGDDNTAFGDGALNSGNGSFNLAAGEGALFRM